MPKYTRKEIIQKIWPIAASLFFSSTPLLSYTLKNSEKDRSDLMTDLKDCIIPDLIILDRRSFNKYDFVALKYDRNINFAPHPVFWKSEEYKPDYIQFKADIKSISNYASKNNVYIDSFNDKSERKNPMFIKKIKSCRGEISGELFRPVSFAYARYFNYWRKNNWVGYK